VHYFGEIDQKTGERLVYRIGDGFCTALSPRLDLRNHSPTGFNWGYGGSGPAQLALAVLADHLKDEEQALKLYQDFKLKVIATLPQAEPWTLHPEQIDMALPVGAAPVAKVKRGAA
jgi:Family of unknown function (DUF6166)